MFNPVRYRPAIDAARQVGTTAAGVAGAEQGGVAGAAPCGAARLPEQARRREEGKVRVIVACERSGRVRETFRARGHDAWSCDLEAARDNSPFHIRGDAIEAVRGGGQWDLMIAHPPCTHLACSGARHFSKKKSDGRQQAGVDLFMLFTNLPVKRWCIENPVGIMSNLWRKPDQIIQPYYFGNEAQKTTCLWLKGLNPLMHIDEDDMFYKKTHVGKGEMVTFLSGAIMPKWYADSRNDSEKRSITFGGIAAAMAAQWG